MSESALRGVVLAHGAFAAGLVDAAHRITGAEADCLMPLSNEGLGPDGIVELLLERVGDAPAIVFTDLPSGSCALAARLAARNQPQLRIVTGVNLPLLLDFVMHRHLPSEELAARMVERGRAAIAAVPASEGKHADRPVPSR